jgi:hypothetical protein
VTGPRRLAWHEPAPGDLFDRDRVLSRDCREEPDIHEETMMPNQPRPDNPARAVRVGDPLWHKARERAAERGETVSDVIRRALERYTK